MFQLFHADVAKVDRDVAYVAIVVYVCCKRLSPMFHPVFLLYMYVASVSDTSQVFYLSFFCTLQVLYLDVSK
jgi:hypothetical protein